MTYGILNWKICKDYGRFFDIATNFDRCPECRNKKEVEYNGRRE